MANYCLDQAQKDALELVLGFPPNFGYVDGSDYVIEGWVWDRAVLNYPQLSSYDIGTNSHDLDARKLVVFRKLPENANPLISDFSILGFRKVGPSYSRGRKHESTYVDEYDDKLAVKKTFSDVVDANTNLIGIQIQFDWYKEDGTIGLSKTEIAREFNKIEAETVLRGRRERQLDFLIAGAKGTVIEPQIMTVFNHYHDEQLLYKESGSSDFKDAVLAETDPTILGILDIEVPRFDDPNINIKVKNSILYQITGDVVYLS